MKASSFVYFLKEGIRNLWANRLMSMASVGILIACLILMGNTILLSINLNAIIKKVENTNIIMVYLNDNLEQNKITEIGKKIKANGNISESIFISKEEALEKEKKRLGEDAGLLEGFEKDNPFPDAYQIKLKELDKMQHTTFLIKKIDGVLKVTGKSEYAEKLIKLRSTINIGIVSVVLLMLVVSLFIIVNTIKIALYTRKREINIMKYVGATNWFIRWPFIFEGLLIGIIGGFVSYFLQWYMYHLVMSNIVTIMGDIKPIPFSNFAGFVFLSFIGAGIIVGSCGSLISIRKYLKA